MDTFFANFQGDSPVLQSLGYWGYKAYEERELIQMYIHLLLAALFPIYIGSHASLRRPPSAAAPEKSKVEEGDDELEPEPIVEGLSPSDAIMFPVFAGITLAGLYFIIKWLEDPRLLNKILTWYFSALGVFGVGKLFADFLNVGTTFLFPSVWTSGKNTYYVEPLVSQQVTGPVSTSRILVHRKNVEGKTNPFPGFLSTIKFPASTAKQLWSLRALFKNHWVFRGYVHGLLNLKSSVTLNGAIGLVCGVGVIALYNFTDKLWWLTNLIAFGFCYGTLQLMSPTTFWTGSLVLAGLFFYDIGMVFYTPLMVTVATSLDVPIKLVFPGPKRGSMLGLGDVVLPGIMMALALRYDLYLHYLRKQRKETDPSSKAVVIKSEYHDATGQWGERFWTKGSKDITVADGARFSKVYFKASLVGYVIAMLVTLAVMNIYNHAQPALLYLVPGVLISLWGTALVRGEIGLMWNYTEDGSLDTDTPTETLKTSSEMDIKKLDAKTGGTDQKENGESSGIFQFVGSENSASALTIKVNGSNKEEKEKEKEKKREENEEHARHVFLFSLSEPVKRKKAKLFEK